MSSADNATDAALPVWNRPAGVGSAHRSPATELAELVLSMAMATPKGLAAARLAREVLGVQHLGAAPAMVIVTTNGTTRLIPRDEPLFLVRGQDLFGEPTVRHWASLAEQSGVCRGIVALAREQADLMAAWPTKKRPDYPLFHD